MSGTAPAGSTVFRLGIDFGTSNTVAFLARPDGRKVPVLFGDSPILPSAVCLDADGGLLVGRDAIYVGRSRPEAFEPNPKRRIDEGSVLLADREVPIADLVAAVLRRVADEAYRIIGGLPAETILSCPANWGPRRRSVLTDAAASAGLTTAGTVSLVAEPVAAASYFVDVLGNHMPPGGSLVVYDFGAGTFDVSVVRRTADGFTVLTEEGLNDAGGLDVDAAVVSYLGAVHAGQAPERWAELTSPATTSQRRANRQFWDDVRISKELLSRATSAAVHVPLLDLDAPLGREQLELLARPVLDRTVMATRAALQNARLGDGDVRIFLVGGSSRIPLVATLLHQAFGRPPVVIEQPELVVVEGCLHAQGMPEPDIQPAAPTSPPTSAPTSAASAEGAGPAVGSASARVRAVASVRVPPDGPAAEPAVPPGAAQPVAAQTPAAESPASPPTDRTLVERPAELAVEPPAGALTGSETSGRKRWSPVAVPVAAGLAVLLALVSALVFWPDSDRDSGTGNGQGGDCASKLGFAGPLTGPRAGVTAPMLAAARWAVHQHNDARADAKACLLTADTAEEKGAAEIAALRDDAAVLGIVGPATNAEVDAFGGELDAAGLPFITPTAGGPALATKGWTTFHRLARVDTSLARAAARATQWELGEAKVYVVTIADAYGRAMAATFREAETATIVGTALLAEGQSPAALVADVGASAAAAVYFAGTIEQGKPVLDALRTGGFTGPMVVAAPFFDEAAIATLYGAASAPLYVTCSCRPIADYYDDLAERIKTELPDRYHVSPNGYVPITYDAARMLLAGLTEGVNSRAEMTAFLQTVTFKGLPETPYGFLAGGNRAEGDDEIGLYKLSEAATFTFEKVV